MQLSRRAFLRLGALGVLGVLAGKGFINSRNINLARQDVRLTRLPESYDGLTIGQITDIHAGPLATREMIRSGVDLLMNEKPDIVALTGDFVSGATKFLWTTYGGFKDHHMQFCMKELSRLKAPLGVYAVLGNHDFWTGPAVAARVIKGLENIGVRVLRNESLPLKGDQAVYLAGVDDYWEKSYNLMNAMKEMPNESFKILLSHNPDVNEDIDARDLKVDLIISGHTHGGQVVLPLIGAPFLPSAFGQKYRAGLVEDQGRFTYISTGLGLFFVPIRLNCPPEVNLLTLRRA